MATIVVERELHCSAAHAWEILRDVGNAHTGFPGVVQESRLDDEGVRTVTFSSGAVVREAIVGIDEDRRRVAYSVLGGRFRLHAASIQIVAHDDGARMVWASDFRPDSAAPVVQGLMDSGGDAFARAVSEQVPGRQPVAP